MRPQPARGVVAGRRAERAFSIVDPPPVAGPDLAPRQRWRLYLHVPAAHGRSDGPAGAGAWTAVLERAGLSLAGSTGSRARVSVAAQLPLGVSGEREIVDVLLRMRMAAADIREAVVPALPAGVRLVDLHDVWVGAPAAPAAMAAADYRIEVAGASVSELGGAAEALLAATHLPRVRQREKKATEYDLRLLLLHLRVQPPGPASPARCEAVLEIRLRHAPDGVGRPDEVVAALAEPPAPPRTVALDVISVVRTGLVLEGERDT